MGKLFAVVLIVITIISTAIFIFHDFAGMSLWLPVDGSAHAHGVDHQLMETMYGSGFLFVLSQILLGLFVWQASDRPEGWKYKVFPGGAKPMVTLAIVLVGIEILTLSFVGSRVWAGIYFTEAKAEALPIDVQAGQFAFYFRYAGADGKFGAIHPDKIDEGSGNFFGLDPRNDEAARDDIVVASMVIPVNREINLTMHSKDVIHSFYVRELRLQQDIVPGLMIPLHFTATRTGRYEIVCTQLCGLGHYQMRAYLEVKTQEEFDKWLKDQEAAQ